MVKSYNVCFVLIKRWLGLWVISCLQSKRRKRFIKVIMGRELVTAFGILFIFPFGNNLYALLWWHIISLFQRTVIKHSKHFLGRTVGLYFCILFESLWAEPTLPPFFSRPRCRLPPGRDCTVDRDEWPVQPLPKQRRVTRGNGALYFWTGSLGEYCRLICISPEWTSGTKTNIVGRVRTWRLKITSQVMSITPIPPARSLCVHGC